MGFEGRSRQEAPRQEAPRQEAPRRHGSPSSAIRKPAFSPPPPSSERPEWAIKVPVGFLAYVVLMMFLPLFQVDCGTFGIEWSGFDLAVGGAPSVTGPMANMMDTAGQQGMGGSNMPSDPMVFLFPILALVGCSVLLRRSYLASNIVMSLLLVLFVWFSISGFKIEREFTEQIPMMNAQLEAGLGQMSAQAPSGPGLPQFDSSMFGMSELSEEVMRRTNWFWIGLCAALAALVLFNLPIYLPSSDPVPPP